MSTFCAFIKHSLTFIDTSELRRTEIQLGCVTPFGWAFFLYCGLLLFFLLPWTSQPFFLLAEFFFVNHFLSCQLSQFAVVTTEFAIYCISTSRVEMQHHSTIVAEKSPCFKWYCVLWHYYKIILLIKNK